MIETKEDHWLDCLAWVKASLCHVELTEKGRQFIDKKIKELQEKNK